MASSISTEALKNKCIHFLTTDLRDPVLSVLVQEAIIKADRDLRRCDSLSPLAWHIVPYDELFTKPWATITDITAADPGVITADSSDSDIDGHGFDNHATIRDIVLIDSLDEPEELNGRLFLLEYVDSDTFSLKSLDGLADIDTSGYTAYSSGGAVYHAGFVLNTTTIQTDLDGQWTFKTIIPSPTFGGYPTTPVSEYEVRDNKAWLDISNAQRPRRWRHWQFMTNPSTPTVSHYLFWYPVCDQVYNVAFNYEMEVPDISAWNTSTYPFHPPEVHDALWHGALAYLAGNSKRMARSSDKVIATQIEVLHAQIWMNEWEKDKIAVRNLSRKMLGSRGGTGGFRA